MKLEKEHLVRLPVWKMDELPEGAIALDKPMESGEKRFQTQTIKDGPIAFQDDDNKYYLESDGNAEGKSIDELPPKSVALSGKTASGKPRFQLKYVVCLLYTSPSPRDS